MSKWEMVKLGDVCDVRDGTHDSPKYIDKGYPLITSKNIVDDSIEFADINYISKTDFEKINKRSKVDNGDIIMPMIGTIGNPIIVVKTMDFAIKNLALIKFNKTEISNMFIMYLLRSCLFNRYIELENRGGTQKFISLGNIRNFKFPLPPLDVQEKIAKALDVASDLIKFYKTELLALDELVQSVFYEMFGDPITNEKGWEVKKLSALGDLNRGISKHRPRNAPELLGGKYPLIQTSEVANSGLYITEYTNTYSELGLKQSKLWNANTLCITIAANIARTAILKFNACFPDSIVGFLANKQTNQIFIHAWFSFFQGIIEKQAPQVAQKNINLRILGDLNVITPPINSQTHFAKIVITIEEQKTEVAKALSEAEMLYNGLMQKFFEKENYG